jgi:uncharacterized protein YjbJ (UPF0337 family)
VKGVGKITGDDKMRAEGAAQEVKGDAQKTVGKVKGAIKNAADKVADKTKDTLGKNR